MARKLPGAFLLALMLVSSVFVYGQGAKISQEPNEREEVEHDRPMAREQWFRKGRRPSETPASEMLHRAVRQKMQQRGSRTGHAETVAATESTAENSIRWTPLGPAPITADLTGSQDYGPMTGRATAVAVDQTDATGNTVYLGGAYGGLWKSSNAAASDAASVTWTPLLDQQATLAVGAVAVHPTNGRILLVGTGEANNSYDSYYGFGMYRSTDGGATWTLITATKSKATFRGLSFSRIAWSRSNPNLVVAAASTSTMGSHYGASNMAVRGIYYSLDAGATWEKAGINDPGAGVPDAASVSSVTWNAADHKFYAVLRYHGLYESAADNPAAFTRLANQPAGITPATCPLWVPASGSLCPVYRGELASHPIRNELYFWYVDTNITNRGIWKSTDSGASWIPLNTATMSSCGDNDGCGTQQAYYNMALLAVPNPTDANATDIYAGAVNIFKCTVNAASPSCSGVSEPYRFMNITHVYGCSPLGSSSHVHPDEHQFDFPLANPNVVYFANDGGLNRTLNAGALNTAACGHLPFDNLNANMGSMTQFVWATPHPTDDTAVLGGTQDNGSPAINGSVTNAYGQRWRSVNNGDGGYNAILPNAPNTWLTANNDMSIQVCTSGINCYPGRWSTLVNSAGVEGDESAFYAPFILDPQNASKLIVGTCRVHRGNSSGTFTGTALSNNFSTASAAKCVYDTHSMISALAAGGPKTANGSQVIYAGNESGQIFVTTSADSGIASWVDRTPPFLLNPGAAYVGWRFKISSIAVDSTDASGKTAYATIQGFGSAHVIKTNDGGANWSNLTSDLPDSPANNIAIDPDNPSTLYVATDVGVFATSGSGWAEVGPDPAAVGSGYLPNVAVMRVAVSKANGKRLLIAATYGRGVWKADLDSTRSAAFITLVPPAVNQILVKPGQQAGYDVDALNPGGFSDTVSFTCRTSTADTSCAVSPGSLAMNGTDGKVHVTFSAAASVTARSSGAHHGIVSLGLALPGILFLGSMRMRRCRTSLLALTLFAFASLAMTSCGGGGTSGANTTAASGLAATGRQVVVQVTATSGTNTASASTFMIMQ